jgi:NADP-dependent aldehyde dehydrogenase
MLNSGIRANYRRMTAARAADGRIKTLAFSETETLAAPALFETDAATFQSAPELAEEVFGPSSLLVRYGDVEEMIAAGRAMEGNLTATVLAAPGDEAAASALAAALETKAGRILFSGVPTGVEVCYAMVHGGPFPATSDGRSTSVGGRAIERFARAVCWQGAPESLLPEELRDGNPAGIWRMVNGERSRGNGITG